MKHHFTDGRPCSKEGILILLVSYLTDFKTVTNYALNILKYAGCDQSIIF